MSRIYKDTLNVHSEMIFECLTHVLKCVRNKFPIPKIYIFKTGITYFYFSARSNLVFQVKSRYNTRENLFRKIIDVLILYNLVVHQTGN